MPEDQELVSRIRSLLRSGAPGATDDIRGLAEQYAQRCADVNALLRQCDAYVARGMRTEAVSLAETPPPVLEAAAALEFGEAEEWGAFCRDAALPVPEAIDTEAVARLNAAYVEEESLSVLLAQYRRVARRGTLPQKISLLRRIARLDPDNPNWRSDLEAHEIARHHELEREVPRAVDSGDAEAMLSLARELKSGEWIAEPPAELVQRLDERVDRLKREDAEARARALARDIWKAYSAFDAPATERLMRRWDRLVRQEDFTPAPAASNPVAEAREWLEKQKVRQREQAEFEKAQARLALGLERGVSREELESLFYEANRFDRPYPEALRRRAENALEDARRAETREFRLKAIGIVLAVLAVALPILLFVRHELGATERRRWAARIRDAVEAREFDQASNLLEDMRQHAPGLFEEAEFKNLADRVERERAEYTQGRETFESVMAQLSAIREEGFPEDRPYEKAERIAGRLAETDSEKLRLEEWRIARRAVEERRQAEADREFGETLESALDAFKRLGEADPEARPEEYRRLLGEAGEALDEARAMTGVSETLRAQLPLLRQRLRAREQELSEARERLAEQGILVAQIADALPDLAVCRDLARDFVESFPNNPESDRLGRFARDCGFGIDLERGRDWTAEPDAEMVAQANEFLASEDAAASLWKEPLERMVLLAGVAQKAPEVRESLEALRGAWPPFNVYSFVATHRETGERTRYYFERPFDIQGSGETKAYRFFVYRDEHDVKQLVLPTERYIVEVEDEPADNPSPHTVFVRGLLDDLDEAKPWRIEVVLLDRLRALRSDTEINPFIKAYLMRTILRQVSVLTFENERFVERALEKLDAESLNVFWMDPDPDEATVAARRRIERIIATMSEIPVMAANSTLRQAIHEVVFERKAKCVGWVEKADGAWVARRVEDTSEMWIVRPDRLGRPVVALVRSGEDGVLSAPGLDGVAFYKWMPLFGPTDGRTTDELLNRAASRVSEGERRLVGSIAWPRCWPVNARDLAAAPATED